MTNVVVVGAQWGDEGKGKIVDWLSKRADVVVRFQGGHNAGHTLVINDKVFKLSLLPSGIVRPDKLSIIGSGVVLDPWALFDEINRVKKQGIKITPKNLKVAENCTLILPFHRELDGLREDVAHGAKIGTTRRGIGPAYEDRVGRRALRLCDLSSPTGMKVKLEALVSYHNILRASFGAKSINSTKLVKDLKMIANKILPFMAPVWLECDRAKILRKKILFEGAQGVLLDVDHGTYPYVTSSHTVAGQASAGTGLGPSRLNYVLGITKAYSTRVGSGPFPTEQDNKLGAFLGMRGHEFGTVTGRSRRCGWFDAVLVRQSIKISGIQGIALTKLDVLDELAEIKICVGYTLKGRNINYFPANSCEQERIRPRYEILRGWQTSTRGIRSWSKLPRRAIQYVRRIEHLIDAPVALLSTSPEREDTILIRNPFCSTS